MTDLQVINVKKKYNNKVVLSNLSLELKKSEIKGLLGPNGAGKTTSFRIIAGIIKQDSGIVLINDKNVSKLSLSGRAKMGLGYLPQEPSVFRKLSVKNNLMAILEQQTNLTRQQMQKRCDSLLYKFNLEDFSKTLGDSLSGGERRRVEIARTLCSSPSFLLLDEPFSGVDPIAIQEVQKIIRELSNDGIGILITDHNVRDTLEICNTAVVVNDGIILAQGAPEDLLMNSKVKSTYLGQNFKMSSI